MKNLRILLATAFAFAAIACADAQPGPGPGPVPSPWVVNGTTISYAKGLVQIGSLSSIPTDYIFQNYGSASFAGINTFTKSGQGNTAPIYMSSNLPAIAWNNTGATLNNKRWGMASTSPFTLVGNIIDDGQTTATTWMTVTRSGMTVADIAYTASGIHLNGAVVVAGSFTATNLVTFADLVQSGANTMLGNWTGSTANVAANAMPSCPDSSGNHLNYVSGTGITCGTGLGNGITALTGDVTATGPGSVPATLATVNGNVGSFGSSTAIPVITANGKGLITAVSTAAVIAPAGTLTGTTLASNVATASLISINGSTVPTASDTFALLAASQALTNKTYNGMTLTANSGTFHVGNAKSVDIQNTLTMTGTDGSSVNFGAGGTVLYSGGSYVSSLAGTANQINMSGGTGAVTASLSSTLIAPGTLEVISTSTFDALATGSGFAANGGIGSGGVVGSFSAIGAAGGGFGWGRTANATDNKYWDLNTIGTTLVWRAVNDAVSSATNFMTISRSGITVSSINLAATAVSVTGTFAGSSTVQGTQLISTIATGTAPLTVASTTRVSNLNAATAGNADTVTTNANLTGPITSSGNATAIASQTGTGTKFVVDTGPTVSNITETGTTTAATANFSGIVTASNAVNNFGTAGQTNTISILNGGNSGNTYAGMIFEGNSNISGSAPGYVINFRLHGVDTTYISTRGFLSAGSSSDFGIQTGGSGGVYLGSGATSWAAISDESLKNWSPNQRDYWDAISKIPMGDFNWKKGGRPDFGTKAQDAYAALGSNPLRDVIFSKPKDAKDTWTASYDYFGRLAFWGVKEDHNMIAEQAKQIKALQSENARLRTAQAHTDARLAALTEAVAKLRPANDNRAIRTASR